MHEHTRASRATVVATAVLALMQGWWAWRGHGDGAASAAVLAPLSVVAALALARANAFESRLTVVFVAGLQLGLVLLALSVGLPGNDRRPFDVRAALALAAPFAVLVLIDLDRRARAARRSRSTHSPGPSPYAR